MESWSTADIPPQQGRRAVVTGATGGLGYETALALSAAGAHVVVAGRNPEKGAEALRRIRAAVPSADVRFERLDLASLASVAAFAERLVADGKPVDVLVNNAGVMALPRRLVTEDGFEMQLGTNYLGHFTLTARLLPALLRSDAARVVALSSLYHRRGTIDIADLQMERSYSPNRAYAQSKLAMLLFAKELQRRSDAQGWGLTSNAAHPGGARTDLITNGPASGGPSALALLSRLLSPFLLQSAAAGALPTLYAATSPDARGGTYYGPDGLAELKGAPRLARESRLAGDAALAARLWDVSERLTDVSFASQAHQARRESSQPVAVGGAA